MAVDTRNRRASIVSYKLPFGRVYPNPDGDLNNPRDRAQITGEYPGAFGAEGGFYKQIHHRAGFKVVTSAAGVPQLYMQIG